MGSGYHPRYGRAGAPGISATKNYYSHRGASTNTSGYSSPCYLSNQESVPECRNLQRLRKTVRDFLPEREKEILQKTSPSAQLSAFASYFEDRYLPLYPAFKDGEVEDDYSELLRDVPVMVMGFSWEDYHELNSARLGMQLMCYLFEPPMQDDTDMAGERIALVDGFPTEYQREARRVPTGGISLDYARIIFKGKKWTGLRNCAEYINQSTDNWFLDTDEEMRSNMQNCEWDKEIVAAMSKEWRQAIAFHDKIMEFADWLEDKTDGAAHFKQAVDFLLANKK